MQVDNGLETDHDDVLVNAIAAGPWARYRRRMKATAVGHGRTQNDVSCARKDANETFTRVTALVMFGESGFGGPVRHSAERSMKLGGYGYGILAFYMPFVLCIGLASSGDYFRAGGASAVPASDSVQMFLVMILSLV